MADLTPAASTNGDAPAPQVTDYTFQPTLPAELRARLQPALLVRVIDPILSAKGRLRFKTGDIVIAQYWGNGYIILYPTNPQDYPAAWVLNHNLEGHVAAVELGDLKGEPVLNGSPA
jgi:hypothetical protein